MIATTVASSLIKTLLRIYRRPSTAAHASISMSADTESGLAVGHLLKMHAKGDITTAEFKQYTRNA